ncbi:MAG: sulfate/molybdate ABC transporter ATP-binding protein, partial [Oscillospiraceae bacterium]|nr:sulfate/molybdate ABC transporter ATP-binding protein [Oscillospiraceae bacterium]
MALYVDIEKRLGAFRLSVKFETGNEVLALFGASGCGKSMTLKCIAGIETPDRGKIILDGRTLFDSEKRINLSPQKRRVGYLFQQYALFPNMTVRQNIAVGVRDKARRDEIVRSLIAAMSLEGTEEKRPAQLSGGQQQRVALARILANEPEVLMLDEPFSALDAHLRFRLEQQMSTVLRSFGKSVLLVSHDREEVYRLSDRIAIMHGGSIEKTGTKEEVFLAPGTRSGALLIGC